MTDDRDKLYRVAETLVKEGKVEQGIPILEDLIRQYPDDLLAYGWLAVAYAGNHQDAQMERILRDGLRVARGLEPDQIIKFVKEMERMLQEAIELDPNYYFSYLYLGWIYEKQQKLDQSLIFYQQAAKLKPDDFEARTYLGYLLQKLGHQEAGVNELQIAFRLNPQDIILVYNLANGLNKLDRFTEALELLSDDRLNSFRTDEQNLAHLYHLRGSIYLGLEELDKSLEDIQKAISLNSTVAQFYNYLGDVYFAQGNDEEAINSYNRAAQSDDEKGSALKGVGRTYLRLEDWQSALNALEKAREAGEVDHFGLGMAYFELGDDERGIENLKNEVLNKGQASIEACYNLGFAYAAVGDRQASIEAFKQFLEFSLDKADNQEWREWRLEAQKQIEG